MKNQYSISSRAYLARAKECLAEHDPRFLFYAAFEVRCGIEARMEEYLEVQEHISKKKRRGWRVAELAKNIEDAFRTGQWDTVLRVRDPETNELLLETRYTPVKKSLQKKAEKLGNYLHSAKKPHTSDSPFWKQFRKELEEAVSELEHANSGRLLGPLLISPSGLVDLKIELPTPDSKEAVTRALYGGNKVFEVTYE